VTRIATLGCRLNAYESEAMAGLARDAGLTGAVVVNTCAVTGEAQRKARQEVRRLIRANPGAPVIVTGCAAQTDPGAFAAIPGVAHVIGNAEKLRPATWAALREGAPPVLVGDIMAERAAPAPVVDGLFERARAHVQVQNGCDHRCTFCIIPFGRGNSRSVPAEAVVAQVARLTDRGFAEVVLTGVDLTSWGADLAGAPRLGDLVQAILQGVPALPRLRISSIDSIEADDRLIGLMADEPRLMPYLHLSLQSGDDLILKRMKRRHSRAQAVEFCARLRAARPDILFGADLIAGFPTEDEAAAERSAALIADCGLTFAHVFPFSPRPGTPAARMPQVPGPLIAARAARLRAAGAAAKAASLAAMVGQTHNVLIETPLLGRTESFAEVAFASDQPVGRVVAARITAADQTRLVV
jgi:threonylcarbamoyladenosine tRNA methylthiotransferase MtaB